MKRLLALGVLAALLALLTWAGVWLRIGLWFTGLYDRAVAAWLPHNVAVLLLSPRYHSAVPWGVLTVLAPMTVLVWAKCMRRRGAQSRKPTRQRVHGTQTWVERLDLWLRPPEVHWLVGDVIVGLYWHPHAIVFGAPGSGKALALDTIVPTPEGWSTMGDLRVGDTVFDEQGCPTRVMAVSEVRIDRPCYEVKFSDGSRFVADADHQWLTWTDLARKSALRASRPKRGTGQGCGQDWKRVLPGVRTTEQIAATVRISRDGRANHSVPVAAALQLPWVNLPLDPYVLGTWLGDGTATSGALTTADPEILAEIERAGFATTKMKARYAHTVHRLSGRLRTLGLLSGHSQARTVRGVKRIPEQYLRAHVEQRLALLEGLMDTDGTCGIEGTCEFTSTSRGLAEDVLHLVSSLGVKATLRDRPCQGRSPASSTAYTVAFTTEQPVFRLSRKLVRQPLTVRATQRHRYVVDVRPVSSVPVRCIAVESPSHLFLIGRTCVPTHNSSFMYSRILSESVGLPAIVAAFAPGLRPPKPKRGRLVLSGNRSDPFRAAFLRLRENGEEAWIWNPGTRENQGERAAVILDVLEGPPDNVAGRIIAMHPVGMGSTGLRAGAVEGVLVAAIELLDRLGVDRTFETLEPAARWVAMRLRERGELSLQGVAGMDDWLERLRTLRRQFGPNIGPGLRISEVLARGGSLFVELSAYSDPTKTGPLSAYFVTFVMWLVATQGDFDVVLDEAGAMDPTLYAKVFQATRAAGVRITAGGQSPAQFDDTIREMCSTILLCGTAAASPEAADWASRVTKSDVEAPDFELLQPVRWGERLAFWSHKRGLRALQGYLLHNGRLEKVRVRPIDLSINDRYPWGSIASVKNADAGRCYEVTQVDWEHMVPYTVVPLAPAGTRANGKWSDGTTRQDGGDGTGALLALADWQDGELSEDDLAMLRRYGVEQAEWVACEQAPALPSASRPSMPGYYARHPLLAKEWPKLSGTYDPNGDWLFPAQQTNGKANRAKIWVPKGTRGYGAKVEAEGGYVLAHIVICQAAHGEPPPPEPNEFGDVQPWTVDHVCHTEDLTCPGGDKTPSNPGGCTHRRCGNGAHHEWASPRQQYWRQKIHETRRQMWLSGERVSWPSTVCQAADEYIRNNPPVARRKRGRAKAATVE